MNQLQQIETIANACEGHIKTKLKEDMDQRTYVVTLEDRARLVDIHKHFLEVEYAPYLDEIKFLVNLCSKLLNDKNYIEKKIQDIFFEFTKQYMTSTKVSMR